MSDQDEVVQKALYFTGKVQEKILHTENNASKPHLHWGQFVVEPRQKNVQVGVYGSASAAIVLGLNGRDDDASRRIRANLKAYVDGGGEAEFELSHNIKLAMAVLALAPRAGNDADPTMLAQLAILLDRCSQTSSMWPAYSRPNALSSIPFAVRDSEIATAAIIILLAEVLHCLSSERYVAERGRIGALVNAAASRLEGAFAGKRATIDRFSTLVGVAIIVTKGGGAKSAVRSAFREAVRTRDFADRRTFFYECLRPDGTLTRDYFIVPPAVIVPMVVGKVIAKQMDRALAFAAVPDLLNKLDDDGLFRTGQDMPSTVEQAFVGLSLQSVVRGQPYSGFVPQLAASYIQATQASPTGVPTKLVAAVVVFLWAITAIAIGGKVIPAPYQTTAILAQAHSIASVLPDAVSQFLPFLSAAWPASRALFFRILGRTP